MSGINCAVVKWEEIGMLGVGLGLEGPLDAGLLPEGVEPGEGGEGEGLAVAPVVGAKDTRQTSLLLWFQFSRLFVC